VKVNIENINAIDQIIPITIISANIQVINIGEIQIRADINIVTKTVIINPHIQIINAITCGVANGIA
jgi:hypothetical protein